MLQYVPEKDDIGVKEEVCAYGGHELEPTGRNVDDETQVECLALQECLATSCSVESKPCSTSSRLAVPASQLRSQTGKDDNGVTKEVCAYR